MLSSCFDFFLAVFKLFVDVFQQTDLGGVTYESVLVTILVIGLVARVVLVVMK